MKKHSVMFLTFSALLTVNAFAPQMFWDTKHTGRFPSSLEEDRLEALEIEKKEKEKELAKVVENKAEDKKDEQVQCLKDDKSYKLEEEIKKLVTDKESILKELADLKKVKKEEPAKKEDEKKEEVKKPVAKKEAQEDVLGIMSQLTSLMISQQQQQMMMMQEMFSMMSFAHKSQQYSSPRSYHNSYMNEYMSPFAYQHDSFVQREYRSPYSFDTMNYGIGLMWNQQPQAQVQPQPARMPSAQSLQAANPVQAQVQQEMPGRVFAEPQFQTPDMTRGLFQ